MTTPIKRAAKAIEATQIGCSYLGQAHAALAAVEEPSEAMVFGMARFQCSKGWYLTDAHLRGLWRAAHTAMMAEKDALK